MIQKGIIRDVIEASPNRRRFMRTLGAASAALGAASAIGQAEETAGAPTDLDVLNFALNLEFLEAEFYTVATTGKTLAQSGFKVSGFTSQSSGQAGETKGGRRVMFDDPSLHTTHVAQELAADEQAHVLLLQGALGNAAVAKPAINLDALGIGWNNQMDFLVLARAFEDVGVTAYAGAAPLLAKSPYLGTAAQILATEALHSGNIRLQIAKFQIMTSKLDSVDFPPPPVGAKFFPTNAQALVETRTPQQVLYIVYGLMQGVTKGGFFPNGINGFFHGTASSAPA